MGPSYRVGGTATIGELQSGGPVTKALLGATAAKVGVELPRDKPGKLAVLKGKRLDQARETVLDNLAEVRVRRPAEIDDAGHGAGPWQASDRAKVGALRCP